MLPPKSDPDYEERLKLFSNVRDKWDPRTKDSTVIPESMRYNGSISTWPLPILRGISALASDTPGDEAWNQVYDLLEEGQKKRMKRITKMSNILPAQVQLSDLEYVRQHYVQGKPIEHKLIGKDERENDAGSYRAPYRRRAEMTSWETDFRSYTRARRAFPPWPKQPAIDPDSLTMASRENMNQVYTPSPDATEPASTQAIISALNLQKHVEGGYYAEIDRNPLTIPNPFLSKNGGDEEEDVKNTADKPMSGDNAVRNASTSIYYMLSAVNPQGHFHRNKGRTIHTLISGRGRYVLIHADEAGAKKRIETFVVGNDVANGEKSVWIVEGGKYKASFLLDGAEGERLLISETVIPGFEFSDHDFLTKERFEQLVTTEQAKELEWLVRKS